MHRFRYDQVYVVRRIWGHGQLPTRVYLSNRKMLYSTSRSAKTNEYFETKLGRRDYVGKIYKLTKFGVDRWRNGAFMWWWKITGLWLSSPAFFLFFCLLGQPTARNFGPICILNGSKDVFRLIHVPFEALVPSNALWGVLRSKTTKFNPYKFGLGRFLAKKIALTLESPRINYP